MGLHIFEIKLCQLNSSVGAAWSEIHFVILHGFISQKLKKLQEAESLSFCPTFATFFLQQCSLPATTSANGIVVSVKTYS